MPAAHQSIRRNATVSRIERWCPVVLYRAVLSAFSHTDRQSSHSIRVGAITITLWYIKRIHGHAALEVSTPLRIVEGGSNDGPHSRSTPPPQPYVPTLIANLACSNSPRTAAIASARRRRGAETAAAGTWAHKSSSPASSAPRTPLPGSGGLSPLPPLTHADRLRRPRGGRAVHSPALLTRCTILLG